jgi:hypothetical protein
MIKLTRPAQAAGDVYAICVNSTFSAASRQRLMGARAEAIQAAADYALGAAGERLHETQRWDGDDDQVVVPPVTKGELKKLYTTQLIPQTKPGRAVYEQLRSRAPHQICPLCGFGEVRTLDHYLAKVALPPSRSLPR